VGSAAKEFGAVDGCLLGMDVRAVEKKVIKKKEKRNLLMPQALEASDAVLPCHPSPLSVARAAAGTPVAHSESS
jgi:hypothetical protein